MALINISNILQSTVSYLKKAPLMGGVFLASYKRNRKIFLIRTSIDRIQLIEDGYVSSETSVPLSSVEKELKILIKREFPRSRKIRLYKFNTPDEIEKTYQKI